MRRARLAALMPAATPPITTSLSGDTEAPSVRLAGFSYTLPIDGEGSLILQTIGLGWEPEIRDVNAAGLVDSLRAPVQVVEQEILAQGVRGSEVGLAAGDLAHLADEVHQAVVAGQHESVDEDAGAPAAGHFLHGFGHPERIEPGGGV